MYEYFTVQNNHIYIIASKEVLEYPGTTTGTTRVPIVVLSDEMSWDILLVFISGTCPGGKYDSKLTPKITD